MPHDDYELIAKVKFQTVPLRSILSSQRNKNSGMNIYARR